MSGRCSCPTGARAPLEKDLETSKTGQFFHQQPFAPIFQQRMGGGASQGAGSQKKELIHACMLLATWGS